MSASQAVAALFDTDGPLAYSIPGFATRKEQVAMADLVARALVDKGHYFIEAGTGVGKTFAYLVPALFSHRRVIVSTGTRTLQDQLFHRDLPVVARALGIPVRTAILKGRANYLCLHRLDLVERELATSGARSRQSLQLLNRIRRWSHTTVNGDIGELSEQDSHEPLWQAVTSTRENCLGSECPSFQRCHVMAARREAQAADVVVVNHHLLMADLQLKEHGFGDLLPGADAVVIDEAHQLPDVAAQFFGVTFSTRQLQQVCRDLNLELQGLRVSDAVIKPTIQRLEMAAADSFQAIVNQQERVEFDQWPDAFVGALIDVHSSLAQLLLDLDIIAKSETSQADQPALNPIRQRFDELKMRLAVLLDTKMAANQAREGVRWFERTQQGYVARFAPVDIASQLSELIQQHASTWLFTSATLAVGDSFEHFASSVGLDGATTAQFGSPFDYAEQSYLYLPRGIDAPSEQHHTQGVVEAAWPVLQASGGRAFLLFTSYRALRTAAQLLRERLDTESLFPLLVQGEQPRDQLLHSFREMGNAVLLGTNSFWEGVDVKGPALTVVVIDKLPFAVPDDPILRSRIKSIEARGGNAFMELQVPEAVITLKQGVGRLIRDNDDFGVVMLCDSRLISRPYGKIFLNSLPAMRRTRDLSDVTQFLQERLRAIGIGTDQSALLYNDQ
jgi:ATP-dependent DNA helicase DinG